MKLKTIAAAAVVAVTSLSSQAASWDWGTHAPLEIGGNTVSSVSSGVLSFGTIAGGAYSLYSAGLDGVIGGGDDVFKGAWGFGTVNAVSLSAGSYYYSVLGGASGTASYAISSAVAAVPEPETYALLGAGLGIIGFVASRRRRDF